MSVTQKQIAELAGVSIGTVDRALNNRGRVNPEVAERIRNLAEQMGYRRNTVAKSLATRKRHLKFAVILHVTRNDFYDNVLLGIEKAKQEVMDFGINIQIYRGNDFDPQSQCSLIDQAIEEGANAIVIVPINDPLVCKKLQTLNDENFPVVFLCNPLDTAQSFSSVYCDYWRSGRIAGSLVQMLAGKNILYLTPALSMLGHRKRLEGFQQYVKEQNGAIALSEIIIVPNDMIDAYRASVSVLERHPEADCAIFCGNTKAWIRAVEDSHRSIHSVVYDFLEPTRQALLDGTVSAAILQDPSKQGYEAVMILFRYFTAEQSPKEQILIENRVIWKEFID